MRAAASRVARRPCPWCHEYFCTVDLARLSAAQRAVRVPAAGTRDAEFRNEAVVISPGWLPGWRPRRSAGLPGGAGHELGLESPTGYSERPKEERRDRRSSRESDRSGRTYGRGSRRRGAARSSDAGEGAAADGKRRVATRDPSADGGTGTRGTTCSARDDSDDRRSREDRYSPGPGSSLSDQPVYQRRMSGHFGRP